MSAIVTTILSAISSYLGRIILKFLSVADEFVRFLVFCKKEKKEEREKKEIKEHDEKVKDACDNGNVEDLLNL